MRPFPAPIEFDLRNYEPKDFETLYAIDRFCYASEIAYGRAELRSYLGLVGAECLVAEMREREVAAGPIAGFVLAMTKRPHGHIITMDVLEMFRRKGIASALLRRAEMQMKSRGVEEVWLETATDNDGAIAFWNKNGYRTRARLPQYYPNGGDAFAMSKNLANSAPEK